MADNKLFSIGTLLSLIKDNARQAAGELKEVYALLSELHNTNRTLSQTDLTRIGENAVDTASKYGRSTAEYLSAVLNANRMGHKNAEGFAELSLALQNTCDISADLAMQYLLAADHAFAMNGSVKELTQTLDGTCRLTDRHALSMSKLAEGLTAVSMQAAASGMDVQETTAALSALLATTELSGSETGNALAGLLTYLQQITGTINGTEIDAASLSDYENACNSLGVSLYETKKGIIGLKEPMQIVKELSETYLTLDRTNSKRTSLLEAVGSDPDQASALDALLTNYSLYEKMLQEYANGTGSFAAEAEKAADTWEGSLNRLSNTWTDTVRKLVPTDAVITAVNGLNGILSVINNITDKTNAFSTVGALSGLLMYTKGIGEA